MWKYGQPIDPNNRQRLNCKLCGKDICGGISRWKYHLAKVVGHEVDVCPVVTLEAMHIANHSLLDMARKSGKKKEFRNELASRTQSRTMGATSDMHSFSSTRPPHSTVPSSTSPYVASYSGQPSIRTMLKQREKEEANRVVTKCFLWGDVPFNIAKNNPYYHAMFQAAGTFGPDYRGPSYNDLRGRLLDEEKVDCTRRLDELK